MGNGEARMDDLEKRIQELEQQLADQKAERDREREREKKEGDEPLSGPGQHVVTGPPETVRAVEATPSLWGGPVEVPLDGNPPPAPAAPNGIAQANIELPRDPGGDAHPLPGFPLMQDPDGLPGWKLTTAANEYRWIGGDSNRVVVGDRRSIVGGLDAAHVVGVRLTQVGGHATNRFFGGTTSVTWGGQTTEVHGTQKHHLVGNQEQRLEGNQEVLITQNRKAKILGSDDITVMAGRTEQWVARKGELFFGGKYEVGGPVKSETILGAKHTTVVGAKIDNVSGAVITIGKAAAIKKAPNWKGVAGTVLNKIGALSYKTETAELKADGKALIKGAQVVLVGDFIELKGPVRITESLIVDGKIYQDGKALTAE